MRKLALATFVAMALSALAACEQPPGSSPSPQGQAALE
jgi:hypothetical protein